jgi:hypothetical protein
MQSNAGFRTTLPLRELSGGDAPKLSAASSGRADPGQEIEADRTFTSVKWRPHVDTAGVPASILSDGDLAACVGPR